MDQAGSVSRTTNIGQVDKRIIFSAPCQQYASDTSPAMGANYNKAGIPGLGLGRHHFCQVRSEAVNQDLIGLNPSRLNDGHPVLKNFFACFPQDADDRIRLLCIGVQTGEIGHFVNHMN